MSSDLRSVEPDATGLLAEQALSTRSGRKLLVAAVRKLMRRRPEQRCAIRAIGTHICALTNAHTLREIASDVASDGKESSLSAHDELLSGFWSA
jgi:hypothetical protein